MRSGSFLTIRGALKLSEASRAAQAASQHDAVWTHISDLRTEAQHINPFTEVAEAAETASVQGMTPTVEICTGQSVKRALIQEELQLRQKQLRKATLRCFPLASRCEQLQSEMQTQHRDMQNWRTQLDERLPSRLTRLGHEIERSMPHAIGQSVRAWAQSVVADTSRASSVLSQLGGRNAVLFQNLQETLDSTLAYTQTLATLEADHIATTSTLKLVQGLHHKAQKQQTFLIDLCTALKRWLDRKL